VIHRPKRVLGTIISLFSGIGKPGNRGCIILFAMGRHTVIIIIGDSSGGHRKKGQHKEYRFSHGHFTPE
jgi:hypothetical protein